MSAAIPIEPQLAKVFNPERHDPAAYLVSEKLDGVRAIWDGEGGLWTRAGKRLHAPEGWASRLPGGIVLDGELIHKDGFPETVSTVRSHRADEREWLPVRYEVFELPQEPDLDFESRYAALNAMWINRRNRAPWRVVEQCGIGSVDALYRHLDDVVAAGGEGLMLRRTDASYQGGRRGDGLLKLKKMLDAEAEVLAHLPGEGKHEGRLGALRCRLDSGVEFNVGTGFTDAEREAPPAVGARVTISYQELSRKGVPRFPAFMRVREDE